MVRAAPCTRDESIGKPIIDKDNYVLDSPWHTTWVTNNPCSLGVKWWKTNYKDTSRAIIVDRPSNFHDPLQWRHNGFGGVSNHQRHDCLLNRLFRHRWQKTSKLRVTGLCARNSPVIGEFPAQRASNAENVSIWWRHHAEHSHHCRCRSTQRSQPLSKTMLTSKFELFCLKLKA